MIRIGFPNRGMQSSPNCLRPHRFSSDGTLFLNAILEERFLLLGEETGGDSLDDITIPTQPGERPDGGLSPNHPQCISIAGSYVPGNKRPRPEHIETLRQFFGIGMGWGEVRARLGVTPKW